MINQCALTVISELIWRDGIRVNINKVVIDLF